LYYTALKLDPSNVSLLGNMSAICFEQKRFVECGWLCKKALERLMMTATDDKQTVSGQETKIIESKAIKQQQAASIEAGGGKGEPNCADLIKKLKLRMEKVTSAIKEENRKASDMPPFVAGSLPGILKLLAALLQICHDFMEAVL
jgi:hypothetical protein